MKVIAAPACLAVVALLLRFVIGPLAGMGAQYRAFRAYEKRAEEEDEKKEGGA